MVYHEHIPHRRSIVMGNIASMGTVTAIILIASMIALWIVVVHLINRPSRRIPSPRFPSAAGIERAPNHTSLSVDSPSTICQAQSPVSSSRLPYAPIPHLLTAAEGDFFAALQAAVPAC
jgi:hypothetical protein